MKYEIIIAVFLRNVSCPARGTWIEMATYFSKSDPDVVVPRKGHVD